MSEKGVTKTAGPGLPAWRQLLQQIANVAKSHWKTTMVVCIIAGAFLTSGLIILGKQVLGVTHIESHLASNWPVNDTSVHLIQFRMHMDPASRGYSPEVRKIATLLAQYGLRADKGQHDSNDILRMVVNSRNPKLPRLAEMLRRARQEIKNEYGKSEFQFVTEGPSLTVLQKFREKVRSEASKSFIFASKKNTQALVWYTSSCQDKDSAATSHRKPRLRFKVNGQKVPVEREDNTQGKVIELKGATELMDEKRTMTLQINTIEMELWEGLEELVDFEGECLFDVTMTVYDSKRKFSPAKWDSSVFDFGWGLLPRVSP